MLALITILSIAGTLSGCGRYGSPVRVPSTQPEDPTSNAEAVEESSDRKPRPSKEDLTK